MKGFVPTPDPIVDMMVSKLFSKKTPKKDDILLDPGCGTGAFIEGVIRWCNENASELPKIVGIESDPKHIPEATKKFSEYPEIEIKNADFLTGIHEKFHYIIGNPPYVSITNLTETEKEQYRKSFHTAQGRFDLYMLFLEQGLRCLEQEGRLVFITPEKFLYVHSAKRLRILLGNYFVKEINLLSEQTFGNLTTYPTVTTIDNRISGIPSSVIFRDGNMKCVLLPKDGSSFLPKMNGKSGKKSGYFELKDICVRISCGVATGADTVFIHKTGDLDPCLTQFAYPTVSGRQLSTDSISVFSTESIIVPYTKEGKLIPEPRLGCLVNYLKNPRLYEKLMKRTCIARKAWYAFHENPPLSDILKPKILCKDIAQRPHFWIDTSGKVIPRHSVYYMVPKNGESLTSLCDYLNSDEAASWLEGNCQRAASGFIRLQSNVLKHLPVPKSIFEHLDRPSNNQKSDMNKDHQLKAMVYG